MGLYTHPIRRYALILALGCLIILAACSAEDEADTEATPTAQPTPEPTEEMPAMNTSGTGNADVTFVRATQSASGTWRFDVTVAHPDTGWEDYADGWDVVLPDGTVLKNDPTAPFTRPLAHPHVTEQPFTRSQSGLAIPADVTQVTVRAHDLVDGFGGQTVPVDLTQSAGENYTVERP